MKLMLYCILAALCGLSIVVGLQFRQIDKARADGRRATCEAWRNFDQLLISQIRTSEKAAAGLTYYRMHPAELRRVKRADDRFVKLLVPPSYC